MKREIFRIFQIWVLAVFMTCCAKGFSLPGVEGTAGEKLVFKDKTIALKTYDIKNPVKDSLCGKITLNPTNQGFVTSDEQKDFHPWGMNYGGYDLLEKELDHPKWDTVVSDFKHLKKWGLMWCGFICSLMIL